MLPFLGRPASLLLLALLLLSQSLGCTNQTPREQAYTCDHPKGDCRVLYEWVQVQYDWPSPEVRRQYEADGRYQPSHNLISGVKVYQNEFYVTVPRLRYTDGVPSTLNKIVPGPHGTPLLRPFPDWQAQQLGDCDNLQLAMSIEIDTLQGHIYVIDPGRSGVLGSLNSSQPRPVLCQPKLVIYDLKDGRKIRSHTLPESVASKETNFLNDIVLDRDCVLSKTVRRVFITDAHDAKLYVIDLLTNQTTAYYHPSMDFEKGNDSLITVDGVTYNLGLPIDGLALSRDFNYLYYCALGSKKLYMVETKVFKDPSLHFSDHVTLVGSKVSQTGGMIYASDSLFFGALSKSAIYRWDVRKDARTQRVDEAHVKMVTQVQVLQDRRRLVWPDSFAIDDQGYLYVTACKANVFLKGKMDFSGNSGVNYRIWRIKIDQPGYLEPPTSVRSIVG